MWLAQQSDGCVACMTAVMVSVCAGGIADAHVPSHMSLQHHTCKRCSTHHTLSAAPSAASHTAAHFTPHNLRCVTPDCVCAARRLSRTCLPALAATAA